MFDRGVGRPKAEEATLKRLLMMTAVFAFASFGAIAGQPEHAQTGSSPSISNTGAGSAVKHDKTAGAIVFGHDEEYHGGRGNRDHRHYGDGHHGGGGRWWHGRWFPWGGSCWHWHSPPGGWVWTCR
jgi:hypothetical protein